MKISEEDVNRMTVQLIRIVNKYNRLDSKALDFGTGDLLYPSEIHVIEAIGKRDGNTVNEICTKFSVTKGAISQIVRKLYQKGLIDKRRNPDYHKEIILSLTARGKKAFEGHEKLHRLMDRELTREIVNITKEELKTFEALLRIIEMHIDRYIDLGTSE